MHKPVQQKTLTQKMEVAYRSFLADYPTYKATQALDELRAQEYGRLDDNQMNHASSVKQYKIYRCLDCGREFEDEDPPPLMKPKIREKNMEEKMGEYLRCKLFKGNAEYFAGDIKCQISSCIEKKMNIEKRYHSGHIISTEQLPILQIDVEDQVEFKLIFKKPIFDTNEIPVIFTNLKKDKKYARFESSGLRI